MTEPVLRLTDVSVAFRSVTAMDGVSLHIDPGETLGLVGESGSGKTTTGAVALGLRKPTSGTVHRPTGVGEIQAVLQNPHWSLDPRLTVADSVAEPLSAVRGGRLRTHRPAALAVLDQVGLPADYAGRLPHELSGGQRQRVAIARALITRPKFVVLDEAVSALDVSVQAQILNLIHDLQTEHRFGALFISHDLAAVRYLAHRVAVMRAGRIVELADAHRFYTTPQHPYSRQLLEAL
ncbi:ATP-binding cassette domain-containing protein [Streptomyces sp. NPDC004539]|uniref:ATP-binding cassette domain-containing protein n=1 Tax=Streptomyces sp. NPDC004539 TaxID=3154280 RepID=UPI00339E663D